MTDPDTLWEALWLLAFAGAAGMIFVHLLRQTRPGDDGGD